MLELSRTVRFCINGDVLRKLAGATRDEPDADWLAAAEPDTHNTYAAWPAMRGLGRYYELSVTCRGEADPLTGYFLNIKRIDHAVRDAALPLLYQRLAIDPAGGADIPLGNLMRDLLDRLQASLSGLVCHAKLQLTPFLAIAIESSNMAHVTLRHQYEFSAAHRLHVSELSDSENQRIFGKCNNPAGHGHNYQLEVAVRLPIDAQGHVPPTADLDRLVNDAVIEKLDHKHLNLDVPQFEDRNPSVEHIAVVIFDMLAPRVGDLTSDGQASLEEVRVWETGKTVCTYRGPDA